MKGIELLKSGVRVANDRNILRVPLKTGETALLQLNNKAKKIDCVVLSKGKIVESSVIKPSMDGKHVFEQMIAGFSERIGQLSEMDPGDIISKLISKAIR